VRDSLLGERQREAILWAPGIAADVALSFRRVRMRRTPREERITARLDDRLF